MKRAGERAFRLCDEAGKAAPKRKSKYRFPFLFYRLFLHSPSMLPGIGRGQCSVTPARRAPTSHLVHKTAYVHALREHGGEHRTMRMTKCRCSPRAQSTGPNPGSEGKTVRWTVFREAIPPKQGEMKRAGERAFRLCDEAGKAAPKRKSKYRFPFLFYRLFLHSPSMLPGIGRGQCSVTPARRAPTSHLVHKTAYVHALREHGGEHRTMRMTKCRCSPRTQSTGPNPGSEGRGCCK